ncbi:MAG: beta-ketoacyl-[acyl-carrier-protein] synthase family protein [Victivallaceae bacterium]|nr:beta-ketoacyl-[acyl-carrier-protein] synthase family protein [Victivallaceae bacterium]
MEQAFITGRGLISPLGNGLAANEASLRSGRSGISKVQQFVDLELDSQIAGQCVCDPDPALLDRKMLRFCSPAAIMSVEAVAEAIAEAGLSREDVRGKRIAVISGVPNGNSCGLFEYAHGYIIDNHNLHKVAPIAVPRVMSSNPVSVLSLVFGFKGESYNVTAACASSAVAVMLGTRLVRSGLYDMVIAGGAEGIDWCMTVGFCACRALSRKYNDTPELASRPFDRDRDGFVIASGAAYVVIESESSIKRRNVKPLCRVSGIGSNSNATDMVQPDAPSSADVMREALADAGLKPEDISYINTHGTSTPVGDPIELNAIKSVFGSKPALNSTKSQTGHMIGATGAAEIIFTSIMMEKSFISPNANLMNPDDGFEWADLVRECREGVDIRHALSNSFAFGGSNCAITLSKI